jgi:hypothetical protein
MRGYQDVAFGLWWPLQWRLRELECARVEVEDALQAFRQKSWSITSPGWVVFGCWHLIRRSSESLGFGALRDLVVTPGSEVML